MNCKYCNIEMNIDHTAYTATGDNSPITKTELFNVPYFTCKNPQCPHQWELVQGEQIPLTQVSERQGYVEGAEYCCGELLCVISSDTYKISTRVSRHMTDNGKNELCLVCPECGKEHTLSIAGRERV